jgi:uncharacterized protein YndB with AHSA1/START domain
VPVNTRVVTAPPEKVWEVLSDGWLYPLFVVGASRMREVDDGWPAVGTRLHHSAGAWPVLVDDETEVLQCEPPQLLRLRARGWPAGEAEVTITVEPHADGANVVLAEDATSGPGKLVPTPVRAPMIHWRNTETLRRLAYLAERR